MLTVKAFENYESFSKCQGDIGISQVCITFFNKIYPVPIVPGAKLFTPLVQS